MKYKLRFNRKKFIADTLTPVSAYLRIRDRFARTILLESCDFRVGDDAFSFVCFHPIASIKVRDNEMIKNFPDGSFEQSRITEATDVVGEIHTFSKLFEVDSTEEISFKNGLFGYISSDANRYFNQIKVDKSKSKLELPEVYYAVYRNVIVIDHLKNEMMIYNFDLNGENNIPEIETFLKIRSFGEYEFKLADEVVRDVSDEEFKEVYNQYQAKIQSGEVNEVEITQRLSQRFLGDEFNVYRSLRSALPSPYLFYFDCGNFILMGSSPRSQLKIKNGIAGIDSIAAVIVRTGNDTEDLQKVIEINEQVAKDADYAKQIGVINTEMSKHTKLLSSYKPKEIQCFAHYVNFYSLISGEINPGVSSMQIVADTFPEFRHHGTPKQEALKLINESEKINREFYGGSVGFIEFSGNTIQVPISRSFLSKNHHLHYQAGSVVSALSVYEETLAEVNEKLDLLDEALLFAENI